MKFKNIVIGLIIAGASAGIATYITNKANEYEITKIKNSRDKFKSYYDVLTEWFKQEKKGNEISKFFADKKYNKIAVYGAGTLGNLFYSAMGKEESKIQCFIEETGLEIKNYIGNTDLKIMENEIDFSGVDVVLVSAITYYGSIKKALLEKGCTCPIISLEDVVYEIAETN